MTPNNLQDQLTKYLTDAHSIEQQALAQMRSAPKLAADTQLAQAFSDHLLETADHERIMSERLEARDASASKIKDLAARGIERQERMMGDRLAGLFDRAIEVTLRDLDPDDLGKQLDKYLADAHAIEGQSLSLLQKGRRLAGANELADAYADHCSETEEHLKLLQARLAARGSAASRLKDAALRLGALNWGALFAAQPDTPAKLAAFTFAVEHLECGSYEMLRRVAERASDPDTAQIAEQILAQEHAAADRMRSVFPQALDAALAGQSVGTVR